MKPTVTDGNCGIDVMSYSDGEPRHKKTWNAIRKELADFMTDVADQELWQECFGTCQEGKPKTHEVKSVNKWALHV